MKLYLGLAKPLLLYLYLPLVLIGLMVLFSKVKSWKSRAWVVPLYLFLAYAIPLGDVTWHSWNMAKVCPKAGLHVYRTVVVDGFYSNYLANYYIHRYPYMLLEEPESPGLSGYIRLVRKNDEITVLHNVPELLTEWEILYIPNYDPDPSLGVRGKRWVARNRQTGEVVAESLSFSAWRGWIDAWIGSVVDNSVGSCYSRPDVTEKIQEILIPSGEHRGVTR